MGGKPRDRRLQIRALTPVAACCLALVGGVAWADPAAKATQQQQLQRQQQEEALQLRMRQQQRETRVAPADAKQKQALEQFHAGQRARQQASHDRQAVEPGTATPGDDAGTRAAKAELARRKAQDESRRQLQRLDSEMPAR
jgi:hypothetical protein